jgi:hypothetical protein
MAGLQSFFGTMDFSNGTTTTRVGTELLLESSVARFWSIDLTPGQRLPFHTHLLNYFWTVLTSGTARSHSSEGVTTEIKYVFMLIHPPFFLNVRCCKHHGAIRELNEVFQ